MARKTNKGKTTRKKQIVIGNQTYINQATGEPVNMNVIEMQDRDFNFDKIWLAHIMESLEMIGNKKLKVALYLISHRNTDNMVIASQREIAKELGFGLSVVNETIKLLTDTNFIKAKKSGGVYMLNPDAIFQGSKGGRMDVLIKYSKLDNEITDDDIEIEIPNSEPEQTLITNKIPDGSNPENWIEPKDL